MIHRDIVILVKGRHDFVVAAFGPELYTYKVVPTQNVTALSVDVDDVPEVSAALERYGIAHCVTHRSQSGLSATVVDPEISVGSKRTVIQLTGTCLSDAGVTDTAAVHAIDSARWTFDTQFKKAWEAVVTS